MARPAGRSGLPSFAGVAQRHPRSRQPDLRGRLEVRLPVSVIRPGGHLPPRPSAANPGGRLASEEHDLFRLV
jgi:hypothetical protein